MPAKDYPREVLSPSPQLRDNGIFGLRLGSSGGQLLVFDNDNPSAPVTDCVTTSPLPTGFYLDVVEGECVLKGGPDRNLADTGETSSTIRAVSNNSIPTTSILRVNVLADGFISRWAINEAGGSVTLDICGSPDIDNISVRWGDGSLYGDCASSVDPITKVYAEPGQYNVIIIGMSDPHAYNTSEANFVKVVQWEDRDYP